MKDRNDTRPYMEKLKELDEDIEKCIQQSQSKGL